MSGATRSAARDTHSSFRKDTSEYVTHYRGPLLSFALLSGLVIVLAAGYFLDTNTHRWIRVEEISPVMQAVISLLFGGGALYVVLSSKYAARDKHWAYATLGTILGYWLKR